MSLETIIIPAELLLKSYILSLLSSPPLNECTASCNKKQIKICCIYIYIFEISSQDRVELISIMIFFEIKYNSNIIKVIILPENKHPTQVAHVRI